MAFSTKTFTDLVRGQATAIQGSVSTLIDLSIGSVLRAIVETNAAVALWLQSLILQLLSTTRASTSSGSDLDSWVADYGLTRLAGNAATGNVTFSRFTASAQALIPIGAKVQTTDGTLNFTVQLDTSNVAYNAGLGGYVAAVNTSSVTVPVKCDSVGLAGNIQANTLTVITTPIQYIDTVSNGSAYTNGADVETDANLRTRFVAYVASLSKATKGAVGYAITSIQQGLTYTIVENHDYSGNTQMDYFYVVVDDGTGSPSSTLLNAVSNAIDIVRPLCSTFGVFGPVVVNATVTMTVSIASGYDATATRLAVQTAVQNYINSLTLGQTLAYTRLAQIAYDASAGVTNVSAVLLNGGTSDVTATSKQVIKYTSVTIS